jgi:hypothetical protein
VHALHIYISNFKDRNAFNGVLGLFWAYPGGLACILKLFSRIPLHPVDADDNFHIAAEPMDLLYMTPVHLHSIEDPSLQRSLYTYREALSAIRHVTSPIVLELRMQLAQAIEQLQNELEARRNEPAGPGRKAA